MFDSTVGRDGTSTVNAAEFANLQSYIRGGGGFVGIHGAADSMQDVPWYQDLVGAGFTDHGSNSNGGILADTGAGGQFILESADTAHASLAQVPPRFFTVDEAYNTNRNPVDMGLVHPLQYENEESVLGQIGYSPGAIMNSDQHAMTWCHNYDGGKAYTTVLGHSWVYAMDNWFRSMILNAIQWTSGQTYDNCVTFNEVKDLLSAAAANGGVTPAANTTLSSRARQRRRRASRRRRRGGGRLREAVRRADQERVERRLRRRRVAAAAPVQGHRARRLDERQRSRAAGSGVHQRPDGHRRRQRAGDARADARRAGGVRAVHAGRGQGLPGLHHGHRDLDRR